jgi:hypothetical protein
MEENNNNLNGATEMNITLLTAAIALNLCEAGETVTEAEIMDRSEALRHSDPETRSAWCRVWNAVNWIANDEGGDDKFGFRSAARAEHAATVSLYA